MTKGKIFQLIPYESLCLYIWHNNNLITTIELLIVPLVGLIMRPHGYMSTRLLLQPLILLKINSVSLICGRGPLTDKRSWIWGAKIFCCLYYWLAFFSPSLECIGFAHKGRIFQPKSYAKNYPCKYIQVLWCGHPTCYVLKYCPTCMCLVYHIAMDTD
jgi:hypothetical protein